MEKIGLQKFGNLLKKLRDDLVRECTKEVSHDCASGDEADVIHNLMSAQLATQLAARNTAHIRRIDAALKRIQQRTYGQCTECEEPIDERRLYSRPVTTLCASCKEVEERMQFIFARSRKRSA